MSHKVVKGTAYLMAAQFVFLICAYVMNIVLARVLGPERYGILGIVFSLLTLFQIMLITGAPRAVSQLLASGQAPMRRMHVLSNVFLLGGGAVLGGLLALAAPLVARVLGDSSLTNYVRLSALFIPAYGIYCAALGLIQGARLFTRDAGAKIVYALSKAFFVVALALTPLGVSGAILGFALAPLMAWVYLRVSIPKTAGPDGGGGSFRELFRLAVPFTVVSVLFNLVAAIDIFFLKSLTGNDVLVGQYAAAINLAKVPVFLFQGLSTVLFPTVVSLFAQADVRNIRRLAAQSSRYFLLLALPFVALIVPVAPAVMEVLFGQPYRAGGAPLALLVVGYLFLSFAGILSAVAMGIARPSVPVALMGLMVALSLALNPLLIPRFGAVGAAAATSISAAIGAMAFLAYILRRLGAVFPGVTFLKCLGVSLLVGLIAWRASPERLDLVLMLGSLALLYVAALILLGEISSRDWGRLSEVLA